MIATAGLKNVNNCLNTNIFSYLETSRGQSSNIYIQMLFIFSTPVFIRHLWQLKTVIILHRCLLHSVLFMFANITLYWNCLSIKRHFSASATPSRRNRFSSSSTFSPVFTKKFCLGMLVNSAFLKQKSVPNADES